MSITNFTERLGFSEGDQPGDERAIRAHFDAIRDVQPLQASGNDGGTDYVVTLTNGKRLRIDVKRRSENCMRYWPRTRLGIVPELALETFSVIETGKVGWTLDATKNTDYVLFRFDKYGYTVNLPFHVLLRAFTKNKDAWVEKYKPGTQTTRTADGDYHSKCVFVPASVVLDACRSVAIERVVETAKPALDDYPSSYYGRDM